MTTHSEGKILVSACLLGEPVRYDGKSLLQEHALLETLQEQRRIISFCPEVGGGLPTPRPPAEIIARQGSLETDVNVLDGQAQVKTQAGEDVSEAFIKGAQLALELCQQHNIKYALLSARSPSCGNEKVYNGQFSKTLIEGQGVTAALLSQHGIRVFNQFQIEELSTALKN